MNNKKRKHLLKSLKMPRKIALRKEGWLLIDDPVPYSVGRRAPGLARIMRQNFRGFVNALTIVRSKSQ